MKQLVSIILPVCNTFNLKTTLEKCLEQTYSNMEIFIIGKKDNDDIKTIIQNKRIKYLPQPTTDNLNTYRNLGIQKAKGHYICFLDTNDLYMKNHISTAIEILKKEKADGLYSSIIMHNGLSALKIIAELPEHDETMANYLIRKMYGDYTSSLFMTRKSALDIKWDETLKHHQDYDFIIRYSKKYRFTVKTQAASICNVEPEREETNPIDFQSCIQFAETYKKELKPGFHYIYLNHMLSLAQQYKAEKNVINYYESELENIKQQQNDL